MKTIRSRRRWIRLELALLALLLTVVVFPRSPRTVYRAVSNSDVVGRVRAEISERHLKKRVDQGDRLARLQLAGSYAFDRDLSRFGNGDPEALLEPLVRDNDVQAIWMLALITRKTDPERSKNLMLQAADLGHSAAQVYYLKESGVDLRDAPALMRRYATMQAERPGWRTGYTDRVRQLQMQAESGNADARQLLDDLGEEADSSPGIS